MIAWRRMIATLAVALLVSLSGGLRTQGVTEELGGPTQRMHFIGPDGRAWIELYSMQQQADGTWRISGCVLLPSPDAGA